MSKKEQLQRILVESRETELEFLDSLTDEERVEQGAFENWSAKDSVAHVNYWMDFHSQQVEAWVRGQTIEAAPQFDQANRKIYEDHSKLGWEAIEAFAEQAYQRMSASLELLDEAQFEGPAIGAAAQPFWQNSLGSFYSHKLLHYSDYYLKHGRPGAAGKLWGEWAERVAPLDEGAQWQGSVRYNAACSQALAGDEEGALESLRLGLEQNPGLKFWSRRDSDLAILHDDPRYRELVAAPYWWEALEAGPLAEALADQALRQLSVLREAIVGCPPEQWRSGEAPHERPAALALHLVQTIDLFSTLKPGEGSGEPLADVNWQEPGAEGLPAQAAFLAYLDVVEERLARFLAVSDLEVAEELFPWTGGSLLGRGLYTLRHSEHHLANLIAELQRRDLPVPNWQ